MSDAPPATQAGQPENRATASGKARGNPAQKPGGTEAATGRGLPILSLHFTAPYAILGASEQQEIR